MTSINSIVDSYGCGGLAPAPERISADLESERYVFRDGPLPHEACLLY